MTSSSGCPSAAAEAADSLAQASDWFMRLRSEGAGVEELAEFKRWTERDGENALAYRRICASWQAVGQHATAPEIMAARRDALDDARRASIGRWGTAGSRTRRMLAIAGAAAAMACVVGFALWRGLGERAPLYETTLGERRTLTLSDGSTVTLDARSRIRVAYSSQMRAIALEAGQARFDVAKDPARPFRVTAAGRTVQALGTEFNVELVSDTVLVTLIEGRVAVTAERAGLLPAVLSTAPEAAPLEMRAGQQLVARRAKPASLRSNVNLERATAWQVGKLFFDNEPLASAAERVNRYAREQIEVDASAASVGISGVFNAGDAKAFVEAVTAYFPVSVARSGGRNVRLISRASGAP